MSDIATKRKPKTIFSSHDAYTPLTMTNVQYSLMTSPCETVVPLTSRIQNMADTSGLARTSHQTYALLAPRTAYVGRHRMTGESTHQPLD